MPPPNRLRRDRLKPHKLEQCAHVMYAKLRQEDPSVGDVFDKQLDWAAQERIFTVMVGNLVSRLEDASANGLVDTLIRCVRQAVRASVVQNFLLREALGRLGDRWLGHCLFTSKSMLVHPASRIDSTNQNNLNTQAGQAAPRARRQPQAVQQHAGLSVSPSVRPSVLPSVIPFCLRERELFKNPLIDRLDLILIKSKTSQ